MQVNGNAPVAQLDRVSGYEPEGRAFESLRVRQEIYFRRAHRLAVRTSPFHGGNGGSIPPGRAKFSKPASNLFRLKQVLFCALCTVWIWFNCCSDLDKCRRKLLILFSGCRLHPHGQPIEFESNPCKPRVIGLAGVLLCGGGFQAALWFGL